MGKRRRLALYLATGGGGPPDPTPPVITGPGGATGATSSISVAENGTAVHTFAASEGVSWSLDGGADVARFGIGSGTGALVFLAAPDFEAPADAGADNTYVVGVRATDGAGNATTQTVTVTVTDAAEGGGATAVTLSGPSTGAVGAASAAFTVAANGTITGTVTVTPSDGGGGGVFTPASVAISAGTPTATFAYTPGSAGAKTISVTNSGGLANPSALTYTATAAAAGTITLGPFASSGTDWPAGTVVHYEWQQGGRIGSAPTSTTRGSVTIVTAGMVPLTGLPSGAGLAIVAKRNTAATDDGIGYQAGTVA